MQRDPRGVNSVAIAITGASGVRIGVEVVRALSEAGVEIKGIIISRGAYAVAKYEEEIEAEELRRQLSEFGPVYSDDDFSSPLASSSNQPDAMAVVPASMKTIAGIANGYSDNLVVRAALSILRLGRRLVVAPRETPMGVIELENLVRLARAGALIVPLCVAYYHKPRTIDDITRFLAGKVLDALGIENSLYKRWSGV